MLINTQNVLSSTPVSYIFKQLFLGFRIDSFSFEILQDKRCVSWTTLEMNLLLYVKTEHKQLSANIMETDVAFLKYFTA